MYSTTSWPAYPSAAGAGTMYPGPMTGVGGVTGTMPGAGYPGVTPGVGGMTGMMPGMGMMGTVPGTMPVSAPPPVPSGVPITPGGTVIPGVTGQEESYVENILRMNLGKVATIYMTFENNCEWNAKVFKGVLEAAGRDHIIISDPTTGKRYLLLTVNLDYITFDEPLNYTLPFGTTGVMGMGVTRPQ